MNNWWLAIALMLVLEGLLPFASPARWREVFRYLTELTDHQIRLMGLFSMLLGLAGVFLYTA